MTLAVPVNRISVKPTRIILRLKVVPDPQKPIVTGWADGGGRGSGPSSHTD